MPKLKPPAPPVDALPPGWVAARLRFKLAADHASLARTVETDGFRHGAMDVWQAAHGKWWNVTHRPTGCWFARFLPSRADAFRVAEAGMAHGSAGLVYNSPSRVRALCPRWFGAWLMAVKVAGAFVDPAPYAKGDKR